MTTHTTTRSSSTYSVEGDDAALTSGSSSAVGDDALVCSWMRRFRDVGPVTLQLEGGPACARLYCDDIDGLAEGGGLAEAFLVEIFRCKLCQFTCGLKSAICSHLLMVHTSLEEAGIQRSPPTYTLELKHDDDDLLLYDMLHDIGPDAGLKVAHSCEQVSSLFEDDESIFPVKTTSGSTDATSEETAQSAHLMTLGLCRITAPRPAAPLPEIPQPLVSGRARSTDPPSDPLTSEDAGKGAKKKNDACRLSKRHRAWRQANRRRRKRSAERQAELKSRRRRTVVKKKEEEQGQKQPDSHDFGDADESRRVIEPADRKKKKKKKVTTHLDSSRHRSSEGGNEFVCSLCHKKLSSKVTLQRHLGVHTGIKLFTCPTCPYTSRFKESLQQHVRTHTGEKPYRCALCPYASIDRSSLRRHSRTHSQEKPHKCQQCNYSSIQKKSLDLHARRHHTGETFPCQQCHYASADRQLLLRHMRRHHPPPAPPPQHASSPS
ncbi:zinc finger protein 260-like isoform X1 [Hippocampus zosterae]|uniref:zinc finger protein 260-like isoform X1 n=1 Tax=Hippocampus zosterae TaxID=109293 RepID=UPI00223D6766|nr:zinc finger protein 260-like isoform X1 [Hippocampus zosterae]XP_051943948.1 zinc finger protein 260-like isoform X1 [Hippocampus zosterae]